MDAMDIPAAPPPARRSVDGSQPSTPPSAGKQRYALRGSPAIVAAPRAAAEDPAPADATDRAPRRSGGSSSEEDTREARVADAQPDDVANVANAAANETTSATPPSGSAADASDSSSLALARLLQEQERAYYRAVASPGTAAAGSIGAPVEDIHRLPGDDDAESDDAVLNDASDDDDDDDSDPSLALARRLMEEEQMEWHRRMLALAGVDPDADPDDSDRSNGGVDVDAMTYEELTALGETIGTQSKGLDPRILERLPKERVKNDDEHASKSGGDERDACCHREECAVCRMPYEDGEVTTRLPDCGHAFHSECLAPWLEDNKECPMCKTEITLADDDEGKARGRTER